MSIKVKLSKWGNSNGICIPKVVSEMLDLADGDELFLDADAKSGRIVLIPVHPSEDKLQYLSELYHKSLSQEDKDWLNMKDIGKEVIK